MAWTVVLGSSQAGSPGNEIWEYENSATAANTYSDTVGSTSSYSGGIRTFTHPNGNVQKTYVRCRMAVDDIERGELSKDWYDGQIP